MAQTYGLLRVAFAVLIVFCGGCIVPLGHGPELQLEGYTSRKTFNELATNGTPFGIIKAGMPRDEVRRVMDGYLVESGAMTNQAAQSCYASFDYFGRILQEEKSLYIAAWHGPYSWGVHGQKVKYGMGVYYDQQQRVVASEARNQAIVDW